MAVPVDKIHRHIEHIIDIALEAETLFKNKRQGAASVGIGVSPHEAALTEKPGGPSFDKRRVCEQCYGNRLQREADAEFFYHVGLGSIVKIGLYRTGAQHHVEAEPAFFRHVITHYPVTGLGHKRDIIPPPFRVEAKPEHTEAELVANLAYLAEVLVHLVAGLMNGLERRAAQLELASGLERDRTLRIVRQRDRIIVFEDRFPAKPSHLAEHGSDPVRTLVGHSVQVRPAKDEFFVLGADPPCGGRLTAGFEIFDGLPLVGDRRSWRTRGGGHPRRNSRNSGKDDQRARVRRQSPAIAWKTAKAATAAVSARNTLGPSPIRVTKESLPKASSSVWSNPPSGPIRNASRPTRSRIAASPIGSPAPVSSHTARCHSGGQVASTLLRRAGGRKSGTERRSLCCAAATACARKRSRLRRSDWVRTVHTGSSAETPSSVAFSISHSSRVRLMGANSSQRPRS